MLMAASSVANHGRSVTPCFICNGARRRQYNVPAQYAGSPISEQTARTLSAMLSVSRETEGSLALIPVIASLENRHGANPVNGFYDSTQTNTSFITTPVDDPQL